MKKINLVLLFIAMCILSHASSIVECIKLKDSDEYKLSFVRGPFGDEETAWLPSFYFSEYGVSVDFMVLSKDIIPSAARDNIDEVKILFTNGGNLTFLCPSKDYMHYSATMNRAILRPVTFDAMKEPINYCQAVYMKVLSYSVIKSITLNGMILPGPYPSPSDFKTLFNEGVGKFPRCSFYNYYREMMPASTTGSASSAQSAKSPTQGKGSNSNAATASKGESKTKQPTIPKGFPSCIEIKSSSGQSSKNESEFQFVYNGKQNNEYIMDLSSLPDKLPEIFNIPIDKGIVPSIDYLVSLGDYFNGEYMQKSVWRSDVFYSTAIYPHYSIQASEAFAVDGKKTVLSSTAGSLSNPINFYFSQDENANVKYLTIQLSLGLKQITGAYKLFDTSYEKKACKEADKYFNNLINTFKKKGFRIEKQDKNKYRISMGDRVVTFENLLNNNFSYGTIHIMITKSL